MKPASGSILEKPLSTSFSAIGAAWSFERIVAAGVEHHQPQLARAADRGHHLLERHGLELDVAVGRKPASTGMR